MPGHPPSASNQAISRRDKPEADDPKEDNGEKFPLRCGSGGGGRPQRYLHAITDAQAAFLFDPGNKRPLQDVKKRSGADVQLETNLSLVPGMKTVVINGTQHQIEATVNVINEKTGVPGTLCTQAEKFWLQWVEAVFPDLDSRAYFLPPVYINRVPMTRQSTGGQDLCILQSTSDTVQDSDIRDDAAMERFLICLQKMSEESEEVMVGLSQLKFGQYLSERCYAAAAAQLHQCKNILKPDSTKRQGKFDLLLIHPKYGFVICNVSSFGDKAEKLNKSEQDFDSNMKKKLQVAISQLDKAEAMLSHLVSDIAPGLRITKTIAFPNLTIHQVQKTISGDLQLARDLCRCLRTSDPVDITGFCLCSGQFSDPKTPWDVSSHVLRELGHWWQRVVAGTGPDSHMTIEIYKNLVARFCGPATTVNVPCTCPPRVSVKTLGQAVWCTGECYTAVITLFPEQLHLLHTQPPTLFVTGPPGTGKTVVLLLMAIEWMRGDHDVYVVSCWWWSKAVTRMLYHLLQQAVKNQQKAGLSTGQLHLLQYDFRQEKHVEKAINDLSQAAKGGLLYVIADEAGSQVWSDNFQTFCNKLLTRVPGLHLWAASCFHGQAPASWQVEYLTRPLRSPRAVLSEVQKGTTITNHDVHPYSERGVPDHTDGPPVKRLHHGGQGHSGRWPGDCVTCGREVASFLHSLRVGVTENITVTSQRDRPPNLQWRDVLVLYRNGVSDNCGVVKGLREEDIPVHMLMDMDTDANDINGNDIQKDDIDDVATARSDVVWVADGHRVRGLERKIIVCLDPDIRFHSMSRCVSQLVIVSHDHNTPQYEPDFLSDMCFPL